MKGAFWNFFIIFMYSVVGGFDFFFLGACIKKAYFLSEKIVGRISWHFSINWKAGENISTFSTVKHYFSCFLKLNVRWNISILKLSHITPMFLARCKKYLYLYIQKYL